MFTVYYWLQVAKNAFQVCQYFATFCALLLECQKHLQEIVFIDNVLKREALKWDQVG